MRQWSPISFCHHSSVCLYHQFSVSLVLLYLSDCDIHLTTLLCVKLLFLSPLFPFLPDLSHPPPPLPTGLHHIHLSERVVVGKDGNLYFAHLKTEDSRNDYTCNVQYLATRTILAKEPITLNVNPCKFVLDLKSLLLVKHKKQSMQGSASPSEFWKI